MPILIRGKTICDVCSRTIGEGEDVLGVPPLISNSLDPLFKYNDRVFHVGCMEGTPDFQKLVSLITLWEDRSRDKVSFLSGKVITSPDDFFILPYLGEAARLARFSFRVCSKYDLSKWDGLPALIEGLDDLQSSGAWGGDALVKLTAELKAIIA